MVKNKKNIILVFAVLLVISIFVFSLFNNTTRDAEASNFAMGSPVTIKVYDEKDGDTLCASAIEKIKLLDNVYLSHNFQTSVISTLNRDGVCNTDQWFTQYLNECIELSDKCERFTLFSGELKDLWKIEDGGYVPSDKEIAQTLENLKKASIKIENNTVSINDGKIDLGALGKGTACDEAINYLKTHNVEKALVTVGGSEAIDIAMRATLDIGDEVIIPTPSFVCYEPLARMVGATPVILETYFENEFKNETK